MIRTLALALALCLTPSIALADESPSDQALALVSKACAEYRGTLQDHQQIQGALATLRKAIHPAPPKAEPKAPIAKAKK